jgi:hypothetical protein
MQEAGVNQRKTMMKMAAWVLVTSLCGACATDRPTPASNGLTPTIRSGSILPSPTVVLSDTSIPESTSTALSFQNTTPSTRVQINMVTTSDWTAFRLVEGGTWLDLTVDSASEEVLHAGFDGDQLSLIQPIERAEAGGSVELIANVYFTDLDPATSLVFEIERGHIGSTEVELSIYQEDTPKTISVLTWGGIRPGNHNAEEFRVPAETLMQTKLNEYIVIGQLNFWYYGPGQFGGFEDEDGNRLSPLTPLLGETYWASDPSVVYQQIEWAVEYGVDAFSIEWTTPRGIGCCGSMEDTLDDVFLVSPNIQKIRWVIFYDFVLRLMQTPDLDIDMSQNINFDQPDVYETFVSDFVHFAKKYFDHPQYLTIDGRPVIYIWASNSYKGDFASAVQEARERVADLGFDVFIVGDEVCVGCFNPDHASLFDGSSTFTFLIPGINFQSWADVGDATEAVDYAFQWWRNRIEGLKVVGREEFVNFQPAWAPQFDNRLFVHQNGIYVPAMSKAQVFAMATVAQKHAQPVGSRQQKLIWLNTWNNWAETTTVEPTANLGPKYPVGNYQFDMLEVVQEVFGSETFYTSP